MVKDETNIISIYPKAISHKSNTPNQKSKMHEDSLSTIDDPHLNFNQGEETDDVRNELKLISKE